MKRRRRGVLLFATVIGLLVSVTGAASALQSVRTVDVIAIFAGAFGAGAMLAEALRAYRGGAERT